MKKFCETLDNNLTLNLESMPKIDVKGIEEMHKTFCLVIFLCR